MTDRKCGLNTGENCPGKCAGQLGSDALARLRETLGNLEGTNFSPGVRAKADEALRVRKERGRSWTSRRCLKAGSPPLGPFDKPETPPRF